MKEKEYSWVGVVSIIGAVAFVLSSFLNFIFALDYGFLSLAVIIDVLIDLAFAFALLTKKHNVVFPIVAIVLAVVNVLSLLTFLAYAGLALVCAESFTDYLKSPLKEKVKKFWYVPMLARFLAIVGASLSGTQVGLGSFLSVVGFVAVNLWAAYADKYLEYLNNKPVNVFGVGYEIKGEDYTEAIYNCFCENIRPTLKAPTTAVFCKPEELRVIMNEKVFLVSGWVDSQNSYGAMIRTPFNIKVTEIEGKIYSATNVGMSGIKSFAGNYIAYTILGIIGAAILCGISYLFVSGIL